MAPLAGDKVSDLYGFELRLSVQEQSQRLSCDGTSEKLVPTWLPFVEKGKLPAEAKLKDMVRKGVPPSLRPWVWMECSGASKKKAEADGSHYHSMVVAGEQSPFLKDIDQDIKHTFPNHAWVQQPDGQAAIRRVLSAYSVHNEQVGYCRSMNHIVALLLLVLNRNEESAFWLLAALVEDILYQGTYGHDLAGCQIEMKALDELASTKLPRLSAHLKALEADMSLISTDWYLTLFCTSCPSETAARVWDALFNEGPKVLFRVALALLKAHESALLGCDNAGELVIMTRQAAQHMHNRDLLMEVAFEGVGSLSMAVIDRYREQRTREVEAAIKERAVMKRRQELKDTLSSSQAQQQEDAEAEDDPAAAQNPRLKQASDQMAELGKTAEMLSKQAASNVKKGFGQLMSTARDLGAKGMQKAQQAQVAMKGTSFRNGSSGGTGGSSSGGNGARVSNADGGPGDTISHGSSGGMGHGSSMAAASAGATPPPYAAVAVAGDKAVAAGAVAPPPAYGAVAYGGDGSSDRIPVGGVSASADDDEVL